MRKPTLVYIPQSIHAAIKARDVPLEDFGKGTMSALRALTALEKALLYACQHYKPLVDALGQGGYAPCDYLDPDYSDRTSSVRSFMALEEAVMPQLEEQLGGESNNDKCIEVVDLGPEAIGVVFGRGSVDALRKDNNVLALLREIVQKGLLFGNLQQLTHSNLCGVVERYIAVSAFANQTSRPPSAVYR